MGYLKTKGIVIREVNTGEADKVITIFSKSAGKITCFARSSRRTKSTLSAATQLLCYGDFVFFKGRDTYSISSCDVIEPFYDIRNDMIKLTYVAHLLDIINDTIQENQPSSKLLQLFLNTLHMLSKTDKDPELVTRIFEIRMIALLGYAPYVKGCLCCGSDAMQDIRFSFKKCGLICNECFASQDEFALNILGGTARAIYHIIYAPLNELFNFNLSKDVLFEVSKISQRYLRDRLEKDYKKLNFLKNLI